MSRIEQPVLDALGDLDTPTVCNALEAVAPDRRGRGYTVEPLVCVRPELRPMVGYALTARISAQHPSDRSLAETRKQSIGYYEFISRGARPSVVVIQDLDGGRRGFGAWWGEVNSNIHRGLGALGVITDGSVRDLDDIADGFQMLAGSVGPSHAHVHIVDYGGSINVAGMEVSTGDLVHSDRHGAVVVPHEVAAKVPEAAALIARRESVVIEAAKKPDFDLEKLEAAWKDSAEIH